MAFNFVFRPQSEEERLAQTPLPPSLAYAYGKLTHLPGQGMPMPPSIGGPPEGMDLPSERPPSTIGELAALVGPMKAMQELMPKPPEWKVAGSRAVRLPPPGSLEQPEFAAPPPEATSSIQMDANQVPWLLTHGGQGPPSAVRFPGEFPVKTEKDPLAAGTVGQFEAVTYGKPAPELRGTPEYQAKFQTYMAQTRPYYPVIQTGEGFAQVNARQPGAVPVPVRGAGGEQLGARLSPNDIEDLKMMRTTYTRLGDVSKKISARDVSGPIEGRWQALKLKFVNDGPTQEVLNELNSMITLAYSLSGKQISYREMEILQAAILPNLKQPKMNLLATVEASRKWLAMTHDDRLSGYKDSGYSTKIEPLSKGVSAPATAKGQVTREQAIAELKRRGKVVNDASIEQAMKLMGGQ